MGGGARFVPVWDDHLFGGGQLCEVRVMRLVLVSLKRVSRSVWEWEFSASGWARWSICSPLFVIVWWCLGGFCVLGPLQTQGSCLSPGGVTGVWEPVSGQHAPRCWEHEGAFLARIGVRL